MIFVFTSVSAFFSVLFWYADKMNREASRQHSKETANKQPMVQNVI